MAGVRHSMPSLHLFPALQVRETEMAAVYVETVLVKPIGKVASRHTWGSAWRYAACAAGLSWARTVVGKGQGSKEAAFLPYVGVCGPILSP